MRFMRYREALIAFTYYKGDRKKRNLKIEDRFKFTSNIFNNNLRLLDAVKDKEHFMTLDAVEVDLIQLLLIDLFNSNRGNFPKLKEIVESKKLKEIKLSDFDALSTDEYEILNALLSE